LNARTLALVMPAIAAAAGKKRGVHSRPADSMTEPED
jgi:hypothetical protein